jgi:hypothetical protein
MLPVSLIFTSGVASGVNSYAAVLVLGLLGRFGHIGAIPPVLERPSVLAAAAVLYFGQFVVGKIPMLDSVWDVVHTAIRPVVGGAIGVVMAQHADANSAATIAAATLGGGSALASHVVKTGMRLGINASPEPFSNIAASLLEDLGVVSLVSFAVFHPATAAAVAAVALAVGIILFALLGSRIRRSWHRRRDARRPSPPPPADPAAVDLVMAQGPADQGLTFRARAVGGLPDRIRPLTVRLLKTSSESRRRVDQGKGADHGIPAATVTHDGEQDPDHARDRPDAAENEHAAGRRERTPRAGIPGHAATSSR